MINFSVMAALLYSCSQIAGASLRRQANCSNGFEKCREWWSLRLRRGCFDGPARLSPGTRSALDMRDWFEAHALRSLRGKSRTQTTGAKKQTSCLGQISVCGTGFGDRSKTPASLADNERRLALGHRAAILVCREDRPTRYRRGLQV